MSFFLVALLVSELNCQNLNAITTKLKKFETRLEMLEKENKALKHENHELKTKILTQNIANYYQMMYVVHVSAKMTIEC